MALGVTVNEAIQPMQAKRRKILVHYYKALNYMQLGNVEEAIVEARRINLSSLQNEEDANGKTENMETILWINFNGHAIRGRPRL